MRVLIPAIGALCLLNAGRISVLETTSSVNGYSGPPDPMLVFRPDLSRLEHMPVLHIEMTAIEPMPVFRVWR